MIYLTGDIHGPDSIGKLSRHRWGQASSLTRDDIVIILGDFGLVWSNPPTREELWWLRWLDRYPATIAFVDGNHENHDMLDALATSTWNGGRVHQVSDNVFHLMRGEVFDLPCDGRTVRALAFGGAESHDKAWRKEGVSWWAREEASQEEFERACANLDARRWQVDVVLTHDCPSICKGSVADTPSVPYGASTYARQGMWRTTTTNGFLDQIERRLDFRMWYFGHHHTDTVCEDARHVCLYRQIVEIGNTPDKKARP